MRVRLTEAYTLEAFSSAAYGIMSLTIIKSKMRKLKGIYNGYFLYVN